MSESNKAYSYLNYVAGKVDVVSSSWSDVSVSVWAFQVFKRISDMVPTAASLTAQEDGPSTMPLLLCKARTEFKKLERPAKKSDFLRQGMKVVA